MKRYSDLILYGVLLAVIVAAVALAPGGDNDDPPSIATHPRVALFDSPPVDPSIKYWILVEHESGGKYFVRASSIMGFYEPPAGTAQRNEVILQGRVLYTSMDIEEFERLLRGMAGIKEATVQEND